jgi:hypothetical protein
MQLETNIYTRRIHIGTSERTSENSIIALTLETKEILLADAYIAPRWITDILLKLIND